MAMPLRYWATSENRQGCQGEAWCERAAEAVTALAGETFEITRRPDVVGEHIVLFGKVGDNDMVVKVFADNHDGRTDFLALTRVPGIAKLEKSYESSNLRAVMMREIKPGWELSHLVAEGRDDEATSIFCQHMNEVRRHCRLDDEFVNVSKWTDNLDRGISHCVLDRLIADARAVRDELTGESPHFLMHGDMHHSNILRGGENWVVIDPQGVNAPLEMECGAFLRNPLGFEKLWQNKDTFSRRLDVIHDQCGWDRSVVARWAFVIALSSAVWDRVYRDASPSFERTAALWREFI